MVVKSKRGRRRYLVFSADKSMVRDEMSAIVESFEIPNVKLITCGKGKAVLRCNQEQRDLLISAYTSAFPEHSSLKTSGTLRTLRDGDPEIRVSRKKKK